MTRILSELLGTSEHVLRRSLDKLERISGHPNADIRLTAEVLRASKVKLKQLGLDPHDTTGQELYATLTARLQRDDEALTAAVRAASHTDDTVSAVAHALRTVPVPRSCYGMKAAVAKRLLKAQPPKRTMRQLGYRSLDSLLKHEPVAQLYAAAWLLESTAWRKQLIDHYRQLSAADFETRDIIIAHPTVSRWQALANQVVAEKRHNVVALRELGAIVLLPLPEAVPPVVTTVTLTLALQSMNEIRASSTFLKLSQVRPDFGTVVQAVVRGEPAFTAESFDQPIHWQIVQRYYARFRDAFRHDVFEPHIQAEDLSWHSIELVLEHLEPSLGFWRGTPHVSHLHDRQVVSFNIIDVALNVCNALPYAERIGRHAQLSLWHELLLKYLKHEHVEQTVISRLQAELVTEPALA